MRRAESNIFESMWPSFVDVMSNLFVLMLFISVIFMLSNFAAVSVAPKDGDGRVEALQRTIDEKSRVNQALIARIKAAQSGEEDMAELYGALDASRRELKKESVKNENLGAKVAELNQFILQLEGDIVKKDSQVRLLANNERNLKDTVSKLAGEMQKLNDVFDATDKYIKWQKVQVVELGKKLNRALANKTAELYKVRSTFFEGIMSAVAGNENFVIQGDRFAMPSEVFFSPESAEIGDEGKAQLSKIAAVLKDAMVKFPDEAGWMLRVDGHTDAAPIRAGSRWASNWELSVARAVSVVDFLISEGVPASRLAATGFGEHHPVAAGNDAASMAKNRRIEFKLTER
ncbi:MAG: OmpA family protein [Rickettsiales bacterium]|jgi:chemotaxis protein MotB|nr:OmpA family protein [Rickettsiales bacterium]